MISAFVICLYKNISVLIVVCSTWHLKTCYSALISETLETCGIFLKDSQPISNQQADVLHDIIDRFHIKQTRLTSLIIKNERSDVQIRPDIFRSMMYDCFLNLHIDFRDSLFSTILHKNSYSDPLQNAWHKKGTFLIVLNNWPQRLQLYVTLNLDKIWLHRVFLVRIEMTPNYQYYHYNREKLLIFHETYFYCAFCEHRILQLNYTTMPLLSIKLPKFQKMWSPNAAIHHFWVDNEYDVANQEFCRLQNIIYFYRKHVKCRPKLILTYLIVSASGFNFTLKLYQNYYNIDIIIPQIYQHADVEGPILIIDLVSPILQEYKYPSIIYCFNLGRVTIAETNLWIKYVPVNVWSLIGLVLLISAFLVTAEGTAKKVPKLTVLNIISFISSLLKLIPIVWRQSWNHKWKLLGILELFFCILISLYENSITVSVVVPQVSKPLLNTRELFDNNYTFVAQKYSSVQNRRFYEWLSDEYNSKNHVRVLAVEDFWSLNEWVEKYFLKQKNETKYAIVGFLSKNYHFRSVTFLKETNDTCYQMYPTESAFSPKPHYFVVSSAVGSSLNKGASVIQASGFLQVFQTAVDFHESRKALTFSRRLAAKYGYRRITIEDLRNSKLEESLITFGNIKSVLWVELILVIFASVAFAAEVFNREILFMMKR